MKTLTLGVIFALAMITTGVSTALAMSSEPSESSLDASYDIRNFGINDSGNPFVTVYGNAGETTPTSAGVAHAYLLATDAGMIAVTSHTGIADASLVNDGQWHANKVVLEDNCIASITEDDGIANVSNNDVSVSGSGASIVVLALTLELTADGDVCVTDVFDSAN